MLPHLFVEGGVGLTTHLQKAMWRHTGMLSLHWQWVPAVAGMHAHGRLCTLPELQSGRTVLVVLLGVQKGVEKMVLGSLSVWCGNIT